MMKAVIVMMQRWTSIERTEIGGGHGSGGGTGIEIMTEYNHLFNIKDIID